MTKKYTLAGAITAGMLAATIVGAPVAINPYIGIPKLTGYSVEEPFQKMVRESEEKVKTLDNKIQTLEEESLRLRLLYSEFPYAEEIDEIVKHAKIFRLEPELLMAIRLAENGDDSLAYGVMHNGRNKESYENDKGYMDNGTFYPYQDEKEKQLNWAAQTVRYYKNEFDKNPKNKDFISYLAKIYAPIGALNDPTGLNKNWEGNVKRYYKAIKK